MASNNIKRLLWAFYASNHAFTKIRVMKSRGNRKGSEKTKKPDCRSNLVCGGDEGDRTPYLLNAIQALSQVSYTPTGFVSFLTTCLL